MAARRACRTRSSSRRWGEEVIEPRGILPKKVRHRAALVILTLWGVSLALPALHVRFDPGGDTVILAGYKVLASGWVVLLALQPGWLANPLLGALLVVWWRGRSSVRTVRVLAGGLILVSLATVDLALRPRFHHHEGFGPGYWLWLVSNFAAAGFALEWPRADEPI